LLTLLYYLKSRIFCILADLNFTNLNEYNKNYKHQKLKYNKKRNELGESF